MIDLAPEHRKELIQIFSDYAPGGRLIAFGSRTLSKAKPHSDLDVLLDARAELAPLDRAKLRMALEESNLPMKVDWQLLHEAPGFIASQAHAENTMTLSDAPVSG